jgi:hypothetical protein
LIWVFAGALTGSLISTLAAPAGRAMETRYDESSLFQFLMILVAAAVATTAGLG